MSGAEAAGAYSTVERIVNALLGACLLTHTAAYPKLCTLYDSNRADYLRLMRFVVLAYWACTFFIVSSVVLAHDQLMRYLFGTIHPANFGPLLSWALIWLAVGVLGPAVTGYLTITGRQREVWIINLKVLVLSLVIGVPGSYFFGAWAWMAALVIGQIPVIMASLIAWREESYASRTRRRSWHPRILTTWPGCKEASEDRYPTCAASQDSSITA